MKKTAYISLTIILFSLAVWYVGAGEGKQDDRVQIKELPLIPLKAGSVKPAGWMKEQMRLDIEEGLAGSYERIWPNVALDLFAAQERAPGNVKIMRGKVEGRQPAWWAGEHEGYWKDALVRLAFLTENKHFQDRAKKWMDDIMAAAKENDGYIGIYSPESRFPKDRTDGELWTQSRIFQAMLAYYEFTGDTAVLGAVERAASLSLKTYRDEIGTYFGRKGGPKHGGVSHAVGFFDTLEWLYRLTGKQEYRDGLIWFYEDFSNHPNRDPDMQLSALLEEGRVFRRHTPHVMEALHAPHMVSALVDREDIKKAAETVLPRLAYHTSPSGNFVGDELVRGRKGTAETLGEYCSMTEGVSSLNKIVAWSRSFEAAEQIENTVFNAAQAARFHPHNIAVQYLGRDNQYSANDREFLHGRTVYAGYHRAAACCTLNSTRIMPYYVDGMWYALNGEAGLFAMLFGESELNATVKGTKVKVQEQTDYPFEDKVTFRLSPEEPVEFKLMVRIPEGAGDVEVNAGEGAEIEINEKYVAVEKLWSASDIVEVDFNFNIQVQTAKDTTYYVSRGPLLYSLPIPANIEKVEELRLIGGAQSGFYEYSITPEVDENYWNLTINKDDKFDLVEYSGGDRLNPWGNPPVALKGELTDGNGQNKEVTLLPHGSSTLRRLTFPQTDNL